MGLQKASKKFSGGGWVVAEIKYSVCPCPFKRTREGRWVMDWYGTGKGLVWDDYGMVMGRIWDGYCKL